MANVDVLKHARNILDAVPRMTAAQRNDAFSLLAELMRGPARPRKDAVARGKLATLRARLRR